MADHSERINGAVSTKELERRWSAVRAAMGERGIDVLFMQNNNDFMGGNVRYFTDIPAVNGYPIIVVFPKDDDMTVITMGPFGVDRTGGLPVRALIRLCFSGQYTQAQLDRHVFGDGGLFAYLGTRDLIEVERRIDAGDREAAMVFEAMIHQIGKEAGAMAAVLKGKVDAVLLTGGIAHSERVVRQLRSYLEWIAPVRVYPGEDELQALAEGVFRVLNGEEQAKRLGA